MDFLAHGLWAGIIGQVANNKKITKKPLKIKWFVFWSIIPDFFAFSTLFIWLFGNLLLSGFDLAKLPHPSGMEPAVQNNLLIFRLTNFLYNSSHSLIIFLMVAGLVAFFRKRILWEATGWLVHILIDIPSHSYKFYPTPFLWPLSEWKLYGFSWANPWFMIVNYSLIVIIYFLLYRRRLKKLVK